MILSLSDIGKIAKVAEARKEKKECTIETLDLLTSLGITVIGLFGGNLRSDVLATVDKFLLRGDKYCMNFFILVYN